MRVSGQPVQQPLQQTGGEEGSRAVVDKYMGTGRGQGRKPQTDRILTAFSSGHGEHGHAGRIGGLESAQLFHAPGQLHLGENGHNAGQAGHGGKGADASPVQGRALKGEKLLAHTARLPGQPRALTSGQENGPDIFHFQFADREPSVFPKTEAPTASRRFSGKRKGEKL